MISSHLRDGIILKKKKSKSQKLKSPTTTTTSTTMTTTTTTRTMSSTVISCSPYEHESSWCLHNYCWGCFWIFEQTFKVVPLLWMHWALIELRSFLYFLRFCFVELVFSEFYPPPESRCNGCSGILGSSLSRGFLSDSRFNLFCFVKRMRHESFSSATKVICHKIIMSENPSWRWLNKWT